MGGADNLSEQGDGPEELAEDDFALEAPAASRPVKTRKPSAAKGGGQVELTHYSHPEKRKNNPEVGMVNAAVDPDQPSKHWAYDPHIDPALQFDSQRSAIESLIDGALASGDTNVMRDALAELKRLQAPYLNWAGKAERTSFDVDTVSLHVHERIDPATILAGIRKHVSAGPGGVKAETQPWLFDPPFEALPLRQALDFYGHDKGWSNRLVAGDSLLVMNSLLQKEGMAGQIQMIFFDPPYGIKYGSNFQPFTSKRDVKDGADADLTQEPEMIKAFRDTWELGIHSYLTYLRDRLLLAKDLLHESGSVFVQIGEENSHLARDLLDEIFGKENLVSQIVFSKTSGATSEYLPGTYDILLFYAKDKSKVKYRQPYVVKEVGGVGGGAYKKLRLPNLSQRAVTKAELDNPKSLPISSRVFRIDNLTSQSAGRDKGEGAASWFPVEFEGETLRPSEKVRWKTNEDGMRRLLAAGRLSATATGLYYVRYFDDFEAFQEDNMWVDTGIAGFASDKRYVVETSEKVLERCLLMTTDPGDLVFDPTCGSGTTAFAAEKWGRRWITCDTSRVAVTLAKTRLMTSSFDYYVLRYPGEGLRGAFAYKSIPHVTLKSIATNEEIDEVHARIYPSVIDAVNQLNLDLAGTSFRVGRGARKGEVVAIGSGVSLREWEVPFDWPDRWPISAKKAFDAFCAARLSLQTEMDRCIASRADTEILFDKPEIDPSKLRVTGPFTLEAVPSPMVVTLGRDVPVADNTIARSGETARQADWRNELLKTGIRGKGGQMLRIAGLEVVPGCRHLHASGVLADDGSRVVVSFGPEHAALEQRQVERALEEAQSLIPTPKLVVFCAFTFDPEAAKDIDEAKWPGVTLLKVQMNTDLLTEDLKKARTSNQSFWLMGQPDVDVLKVGGRWQVQVNGFDYFDTKTGELVSGGKKNIAMWSLDTDYDGRAVFPRQTFFPMAGAKDGWNRLKANIRAELDTDLLDQFHGTLSLPFDAGEHKRIAVKIVDDRGIESLKIVLLDD